MKDGTPTLCIGLPVRNGEAYLSDALESALGQTFSDFELIISDNASTDATQDICRTYADRDRRIRYTRVDRNIGAGPNFNRVFAFCRSPLFKWMPHDDILAPSFLQRCVAMLHADRWAVLAHTAVSMIDEDGRPLKVRGDGKVIDRHGRGLLDIEPLHLAEGDLPQDRFSDALRRMNWCIAALGVLRADALRRTHLLGGFYGGDYVLLGELALLGRFRQDEEQLYLKRCHSGISVHLGYQARARMIDPQEAPGLPGLKLRRAYLRALTVAPLNLGQKLSCLGTVARVSLRNPLLYRLLPHGLRSLPLVGGLMRSRVGG
jgi:glycosyltransferase involved in cell wall biosynthesis